MMSVLKFVISSCNNDVVATDQNKLYIDLLSPTGW